MPRTTLVCVILLAGLRTPATPAAVKELGGCGNGRHAQSLAVQPETGNLVSVGMERIAVHTGNVSNEDFERIHIPYATRALASGDGERFLVRQGKSVHVYDFSTFERLGRRSVKVLKDQSFVAWRWPSGSDEIVAVSFEDRSGMFAMKPKLVFYLLRFDVGSGKGTALPLETDATLRSAVFDAAGKRVAIALADGTVQLRDTTSGSLLDSYHPHGASPWNRYGMAFHPERELLVTSDGSRLVGFDLAAGGVPEPWEGSKGGTFLAFVDHGRHMLIGDQTELSFTDERGRPLESRSPPGDDLYSEFHVAEPLRRVYTLGSDFVCWRTFNAWQRIAASGESP